MKFAALLKQKFYFVPRGTNVENFLHIEKELTKNLQFPLQGIFTNELQYYILIITVQNLNKYEVA